MTPPTLRWAVLTHEETGRPINVFVLAGPAAAVVYSHRAGTWRVDPEMVARTSAEDRAEGTGRLRETDRAGAERAAAEFGTTLPTEAELLQMMEQGAAEMYATDDRMTYIQLSDDDPGARRD